MKHEDVPCAVANRKAYQERWFLRPISRKKQAERDKTKGNRLEI